jgi:hypothetical protein
MRSVELRFNRTISSILIILNFVKLVLVLRNACHAATVNDSCGLSCNNDGDCKLVGNINQCVVCGKVSYMNNIKINLLLLFGVIV